MILGPVVVDPTQYGPSARYLSNARVKRAGAVTQWTEEMKAEYRRCASDVEYFARKYVKIVNLDKGLVSIEPFPFQLDLWRKFDQNRFNVVLAARQIGKTTTVLVKVLHYVVFNSDKKVAILANKESTAKKMLRDLKIMLQNLPFWLQPGCEELNKTSIEFETGSKVYAGATSADSIRGDSINWLILDEFAFVKNDEEFMDSSYPTIASGRDTRITVISTPNGVGNEFHTIWVEATSDPKVNTYVATKIDWRADPRRDEEWERVTRANMSKRRWRQEMDTIFLGSSNTLLDGEALESLERTRRPPLETYSNDCVHVFEHPVPDHSYVMTVDVSKGRNKDASTFTVFDVTKYPLRQVASLRDAKQSPLSLHMVLHKWARRYNDAYVVVESNDRGSEVARGLLNELDYENVFVEDFSRDDGVGVYVDRRVKAVGCSTMAEMIERGRMVVVDARTIAELGVFVPKGSSYEAKPGKHDDLVANLWLMAWFATTEDFEEFSKTGRIGRIEAEEARSRDAALVMPLIYANGMETVGDEDWDIARSLLTRKPGDFPRQRTAVEEISRIVDRWNRN